MELDKMRWISYSMADEHIVFVWQDMRTPLHYAASWGKLDVAQLLLQSGANIQAKNKVTPPPLHIVYSSQMNSYHIFHQ
jgi:ankyrin repeat protein